MLSLWTKTQLMYHCFGMSASIFLKLIYYVKFAADLSFKIITEFQNHLTYFKKSIHLSACQHCSQILALLICRYRVGSGANTGFSIIDVTQLPKPSSGSLVPVAGAEPVLVIIEKEHCLEVALVGLAELILMHFLSDETLFISINLSFQVYF